MPSAKMWVRLRMTPRQQIFAVLSTSELRQFILYFEHFSPKNKIHNACTEIAFVHCTSIRGFRRWQNTCEFWNYMQYIQALWRNANGNRKINIPFQIPNTYICHVLGVVSIYTLFVLTVLTISLMLIPILTYILVSQYAGYIEKIKVRRYSLK
jgi:hypothetical protein